MAGPEKGLERSVCTLPKMQLRSPGIKKITRKCDQSSKGGNLYHYGKRVHKK